MTANLAEGVLGYRLLCAGGGCYDCIKADFLALIENALSMEGACGGNLGLIASCTADRRAFGEPTLVLGLRYEAVGVFERSEMGLKIDSKAIARGAAKVKAGGSLSAKLKREKKKRFIFKIEF